MCVCLSVSNISESMEEDVAFQPNHTDVLS